jgi:hypothetical protein
VAIKSNSGLSRRVNIKNIIMQGSVWGSLCCVVLMDKLGKLAYNNPELLYYYKGLVGTPPLQMVDDVMAIQKCSTKSLKLNNAINTFIELEKLTLSKKKSHNIHLGKQDKECPNLKVHNEEMEQSNQEKYLGDLVDKSGKVRPNIEARKARGFGIVSNILAIVNEIPLGHWKVDAGLRLRQAMLVNGILFNSEAWHGVSKADLSVLEKVDESLLRGLLKGHSKLPLEALYLETASLPIRHIVSSRRIMYLHNILQKSSDEIVRKVYEAQKQDTSPGDFYQLVCEDKESIGLNMSDQEMQTMSKEKLRNIVRNKTRQAAFQYLKRIQEGHSKMNGLQYNTFEKAAYLSSPVFNSDSIKVLLALRTRTVEGIRNDFRGMYASIECPLQCGEDDKIQHILDCSVIKQHHKSENVSRNDIQYSDVFSCDTVIQKQVTELYQQLLEVRSRLTNSEPDTSGPVHCS